MATNAVAGHYTKFNVTVFGWNSVTGMLDNIGSGVMECTISEIENGALFDPQTSPQFGKENWTFTGKLRCSATQSGWFTKRGTSGALVFTSDTSTISGTWGCFGVKQNMDDAMTWDVTLRGMGDVVAA